MSCQLPWKEAVCRLVEARRNGIQSTVQQEVLCNAAANSACKKGDWRRALQLLPLHGFERNVLVAHGIAVDACARGAVWARALQQLGSWAACGGEASPVALGAAARGLAKSGSPHSSGGGAWRRAAQLLALSEPPSVFVANAVLSACCRARLSQQALQLLSDMRLDGPQPDTASYNTMLGLCAEEGHVAQAARLLKAARHQSVQSNLLMYNLALKSALGASSWQHASGVLLGMSSDSVPNDEISSCTAIASCARAGPWRLGLALLQTLPARVPSLRGPSETIPFSTAASAAIQAKQWTFASWLLDNVRCCQLQTDTDTFAALSTACMTLSAGTSAELGRGRFWSLAAALLRTCERQHGPAPETSMGPAATTFSRLSQWEQGAELLADMQASGIRLNLIFYNSAAMSTWRSVSSLLTGLRKRGLEPDAASWNALLVASAWEQSAGALAAMGCLHVEVDRVSVSTFLGSLNSAPWRSGLQGLAKAVRTSGSVDGILATVLLRSCAALRSWQQSLQLQASLEAVGSGLRLSSDAGPCVAWR